MRRAIVSVGVTLLLAGGVTACSSEHVVCGSSRMDASLADGCAPPPTESAPPPPAPPTTKGSVAAALPGEADMAELDMPEKLRSWTRTRPEPEVCDEARAVCDALTAYGVSAYESADGKTGALFEVYGYGNRAEARAAQNGLAEHKVVDGGGRPKDIPCGGERSRGVELGTIRAPEGHGLAFQYGSYVVWMEYTTKAPLQDTETIEKLSALQLRSIDGAVEKAGKRADEA